MNNPQIQVELQHMKLSNEAMFQLIRKIQNDVELMKVKVDSFIDETNEISTIHDIVSRINKLENQLLMVLSQRPDLDPTQNISLTIS